MYAVVYGPEWEDIAYYSDFVKAKKKLVVQSHHEEGHGHNHFYPSLYEYKDEHGWLKKSNRFFMVDYEALQVLLEDMPIHDIIEDNAIVDSIVKTYDIALDAE